MFSANEMGGNPLAGGAGERQSSGLMDCYPEDDPRRFGRARQKTRVLPVGADDRIGAGRVQRCVRHHLRARQIFGSRFAWKTATNRIAFGSTR
jgi:hypothetical protein